MRSKGWERHRLRLAGAPYAFLVFLASACALALHSQPAQAAVTRAGKLQATVFDDFRHGRSVTRYHLRSGKQEIAVRPTELSAEAGERVTVTGEVRDGRLVGPVEAATPPAQPAAIAPGPRKTAVILFTFGAGGAWPQEEARSEVFTGTKSVNAFYQEESYGEISLTGKLRPDGDIFGWYSVNTPTVGCPAAPWKAKAEEARLMRRRPLRRLSAPDLAPPHQSSAARRRRSRQQLGDDQREPPRHEGPDDRPRPPSSAFCTPEKRRATSGACESRSATNAPSPETATPST